MNDSKGQVSGEIKAGGVEPCCEGGGCCPSGSETGGKSWKTLITVLILIAAGIVLARSFIGKSDAAGDESQGVFTPTLMSNVSDAASPITDAAKAEMSVGSDSPMETPAVADETRKQDIPVKADPSLWKAELNSLASLNTVAANTDAVFILISAGDQPDTRDITVEIDAAVRKIKSDSVRVSAFRLKDAAPEYAQLVKQFSVPCVLALVKGGGMSAVSGEISEAKLVEAFVTASRPISSCCPPGSTTCPPQN